MGKYTHTHTHLTLSQSRTVHPTLECPGRNARPAGPAINRSAPQAPLQAEAYPRLQPADAKLHPFGCPPSGERASDRAAWHLLILSCCTFDAQVLLPQKSCHGPECPAMLCHVNNNTYVMSRPASKRHVCVKSCHAMLCHVCLSCHVIGRPAAERVQQINRVSAAAAAHHAGDHRQRFVLLRTLALRHGTIKGMPSPSSHSWRACMPSASATTGQGAMRRIQADAKACSRHARSSKLFHRLARSRFASCARHSNAPPSAEAALDAVAVGAMNPSTRWHEAGDVHTGSPSELGIHVERVLPACVEGATLLELTALAAPAREQPQTPLPASAPHSANTAPRTARLEPQKHLPQHMLIGKLTTAMHEVQH